VFFHHKVFLCFLQRLKINGLIRFGDFGLGAMWRKKVFISIKPPDAGVVKLKKNSG